MKRVNAIILVWIALGMSLALAAEVSDIQPTKLMEARRALNAHHPDEALKLADGVIAFYIEKYATESRTVYCSRSPTETVSYLLSAVKNNKNAVVGDIAWSDAYFVRAYALLELRRQDDARTSLEKALNLSPNNAQYIGELAYIVQRQKHWQESLDLFARAEECAKTYSPEQTKISETTRALRGEGFCLVELGRLDDAVAKYQACLKLDPNDRSAREELGYVEKQKKIVGAH